MSEQKKLLFVMNTLGRGGAEQALITLLRRLEGEGFAVSLYVMLGQGELIEGIPAYVRVLNRRYDRADVLSAAGKRRLAAHVLRRVLHRGTLLRELPDLLRRGAALRRDGAVRLPQLLWRAIADGTDAPEEDYDLAVAFLEGAATYYVSEKVRAKRKAAFLHIDYAQAGYSPALDRDDYAAFDRIFCVSEAVRQSFLPFYPRLEGRTAVFHNLMDSERILRRAKEPGGFRDGYAGVRIVTLGRLVRQKRLDLSVEALALLRRRGIEARWYVFGEGEERPALEKLIAARGLREDFLLPGTVDNPFPYLVQADIYAQCSAYEGASIAIREALILHCAVVATDSPTFREQIRDGETGLLTALEPQAIADTLARLIEEPSLRDTLAAAAKDEADDDLTKLLELLKEEADND